MLVGNAHAFLARRYCCVYCIDSKSGDTTVCTSMQTPCIKFYAVFYIVSHHMLSTAAVVNKKKKKQRKKNWCYTHKLWLLTKTRLPL